MTKGSNDVTTMQKSRMFQPSLRYAAPVIKINKTTIFIQNESLSDDFQSHFSGVRNQKELLDFQLDRVRLLTRWVVQHKHRRVKKNDQQNNELEQLILNYPLANVGYESFQKRIFEIVLQNKKYENSELEQGVAVMVHFKYFEFSLGTNLKHLTEVYFLKKKNC